MRPIQSRPHLNAVQHHLMNCNTVGATNNAPSRAVQCLRMATPLALVP